MGAKNEEFRPHPGPMTSQIRHNMDAPNEKPLAWNEVLGRGGEGMLTKVAFAAFGSVS